MGVFNNDEHQHLINNDKKIINAARTENISTTHLGGETKTYNFPLFPGWSEIHISMQLYGRDRCVYFVVPRNSFDKKYPVEAYGDGFPQTRSFRDLYVAEILLSSPTDQSFIINFNDVGYYLLNTFPSSSWTSRKNEHNYRIFNLLIK